MGKTEKGAVWLDAGKTSPYEYYQYWINTEDADVEKFLTLFTFLPLAEVCELGKLHGAEIREAKARLAFEATSLVHGKEETRRCVKVAKALFGGDSFSEGTPSTPLPPERLKDGIGIFDAFRETGLCKSNGEARRLLTQGGLYVNNEGMYDPDYRLTSINLHKGGILLRAGKKRYHRLIFESLP